MTLRRRKRREDSFRKAGRTKVRNVKQAQREEWRSGADGLTWEEKAVFRARRVEGDAPLPPAVAE